MQDILDCCCGLDIHKESIVACLLKGPLEAGLKPRSEIREFGTQLKDLLALRKWLEENLSHYVAMESTGVYWIAPHEILERHGLEVLLVCTRTLAQVPGRKKSDRIDCNWIQRLHSCGLLRGSFRPAEQVCMLRTLVRDKGTLIAERADWIRRIQKSLDQMNVRVHRAVSDLEGATGMAIIRAIVGGERNPERLAELRDPGCRKSPAEIAEQLSGHWREDHLFSLEQHLKMHDAIAERIQAYDRQILQQLNRWEPPEGPDQAAPPLANRNKAKMIRQRGEEPLRQGFLSHERSGRPLMRWGWEWCRRCSRNTVPISAASPPKRSSFPTSRWPRSAPPVGASHSRRKPAAVPRRHGHARRRTYSTPQQDGPGSVFPPHRQPPRSRCRRLRHRQETCPMDLSPAPLRATLCR